MSGVTLIQVPYHLGREGEVLGAGPAPLAEAIGGESIVVERTRPFDNEVASSFDVIRALADTVRETIGAGRFPLVLAGNCNSSLGTVAGLGREVGVVWFDAHADFNTPDTTPTGFFDGFGLRMLTGTGWRTLRETVEGHQPVLEEHALLVGARNFDPGEEERLARSAIGRADAGSLAEALDELAGRVDAVYVHIDLDVLDSSEGKANSLAVPGGFSAAELEGALEAVRARFDVPAAALTAYDPPCDPEGRVPIIAASLAHRLVPETVVS
jgi:arginase